MAGALPAHALLQAHASDSLLAGRVTSLDVSPFDYFNCLLRIPVADTASSRSAGKKAPCPMVSAIGMLACDACGVGFKMRVGRRLQAGTAR